MNHSRRVVVSYQRKYVDEVLVNCLFKLAQEKVWLDDDSSVMTIAVDWDVKQQNLQTKEIFVLSIFEWLFYRGFTIFHGPVS